MDKRKKMFINLSINWIFTIINCYLINKCMYNFKNSNIKLLHKFNTVSHKYISPIVADD